MQFFRDKRLFIFLIGFIVLVALIGYSLKDREKVSLVEGIINDAAGWTQHLINLPVEYAADVFSNIKDFRNIYEENKILKEQLAQYKGLVYESQEVKSENEELRAALDIMESDSIRGYDAVQAIVVSRSPERWLEQVTLNRGKRHGVEANMLVMTADGMVGKIQNAYDFTSSAKLLTGFDQFNRVSAMVSRADENNIFGVIEGFDKETNLLIFRIIEESDSQIKEDDLVFTSGMGGVFPAGITIGTVKEVVSDQYSLTQVALVEPAADLYDINHVLILDREASKSNEANARADDSAARESMAEGINE